MYVRVGVALFYTRPYWHLGIWKLRYNPRGSLLTRRADFLVIRIYIDGDSSSLANKELSLGI